MKKTLKTITSAILIAIIALGSTVAAFATGGSIEWAVTEYEMSRYFTYGGEELELGTTKIKNTNSEESLVYFDFEAENSGYYLIDTMDDSWVYLPESYSDGKAYDYSESTSVGDNEERIFFIEKGATVIGINFYENRNDKIEIEFMGEEVTDFTIDEDALENYIIGWDIYECDPEYFGVETDTVITFSNGKTLSLEDYYFEGRNEDIPEEGENKATVTFLNKSKEVTYTAYEVESMVKSAEITNVEDYLTAKEDYNGYLYPKTVHTETLTVYFTDGTKYTEVIYDGYGEIELPCGKTVSVWVGEHWDENLYFGINIAGTVIERYEYETERQTLAENIVELKEDNQNYLDWSKNDFICAINSLASDPEWAKVNFKWSIEEFFQVFINIINFMEYYISIT